MPTYNEYVSIDNNYNNKDNNYSSIINVNINCYICLNNDENDLFSHNLDNILENIACIIASEK